MNTPIEDIVDSIDELETLCNVFISEMRIEHAIALIENDTNKKYTLEAIGNMSGFHSRTTFYVSFKKHTGVSPLEYSNMTK